jgi:hypothetical protein
MNDYKELTMFEQAAVESQALQLTDEDSLVNEMRKVMIDACLVA